MPREVEIEFIGDPELTGVPIGTKRLVYGVDADEYQAKNLAIITNEFPAPRSWLLDEYGNVPVGVLSGSQVKQSPEQRVSEQQYLRDQVKHLDAKHAEQQEQKRLKDSVEAKRREVARG